MVVSHISRGYECWWKVGELWLLALCLSVPSSTDVYYSTCDDHGENVWPNCKGMQNTPHSTCWLINLWRSSYLHLEFTVFCLILWQLDAWYTALLGHGLKSKSGSGRCCVCMYCHSSTNCTHTHTHTYVQVCSLLILDRLELTQLHLKQECTSHHQIRPL